MCQGKMLPVLPLVYGRTVADDGVCCLQGRLRERCVEECGGDKCQRGCESLGEAGLP